VRAHNRQIGELMYDVAVIGGGLVGEHRAALLERIRR
jgi:L-2-hydroxyglutarate oxidase LhgO